jgi:hypothetical protein
MSSIHDAYRNRGARHPSIGRRTCAECYKITAGEGVGHVHHAALAHVFALPVLGALAPLAGVAAEATRFRKKENTAAAQKAKPVVM